MRILLKLSILVLLILKDEIVLVLRYDVVLFLVVSREVPASSIIDKVLFTET